MAALALAAATVAAAGCAAPLGPGFTIEQQRLEAAVIRTPQPHVDVRASWRVKNTGDRPLGWLDVVIPEAESHGLTALRVESDGKEVSPGRARYGEAVRIPLEQPFEMKDRRDIAVSYSLAGGAGVVADEAGFVLPPGDWAPALVSPEGQGSFSRGSETPKKWEMTVRVPTGFRVYASGREHGHHIGGQEVEFRFQQRRGGALPFAAGGAYQEARLAAPGGEVVFWTRQALPQDSTQLAAGVTAQAVQFYDGLFGDRPKDARPVHIIECVSPQPCWVVPGAALPGAELYSAQFWNSAAWPVDRELARTWLDFRVHPEWREEPYPMGALASYAADVAAAGSGGPAVRQRVIRERMEEFNRLELPERAIAPLNVRLTDSPAVRRYAEFQSEFFFLALEDAAGSENLRRGLRHLLTTYAGGVWRTADLRSAVEQECGKDLGPLFRAWLTEAGIPAEFRGRY